MKSSSTRRSERPHTPAFLTENHRGMEVATSNSGRALRRSPAPNASKALGFLPKLTAEIGFAMAGRDDVSVELLPGAPTTVAFSAKGKLLSLMVLPLGADQARRLLGAAPSASPDLAADHLWEEQREVPTPETLLTGPSAWNS